MNETVLEARIFRKMAALLLGFLGLGSLLFGLVIGLSTVYGTPDTPSSSGATTEAIDCGTPFSPTDGSTGADDPYGSHLTDFGIKGCQSTMGLTPHVAIALSVLGGIALLGSIGFVVALGSSDSYRADPVAPALSIPPAVNPNASALNRMQREAAIRAAATRPVTWGEEEQAK